MTGTAYLRGYRFPQKAFLASSSVTRADLLKDLTPHDTYIALGVVPATYIIPPPVSLCPNVTVEIASNQCTQECVSLCKGGRFEKYL